MLRIHHSSLRPSDITASLLFYRDGIGLSVLHDVTASGPWSELFDIEADRMRTVLLGHPDRREAGILELVEFDGGQGLVGRQSPPTAGFFLLAFHTDIPAATARLEALGHGVREVERHGRSGPVKLATVRDPDGLLVELFQYLGEGPEGFPFDPEPSPRRPAPDQMITRGVAPPDREEYST